MINVNAHNFNAHRPLVRARVVYEDINDHDCPVHQRTVEGLAGSKVDFDHYKHQIPHGYEFVGYGNFDQKLVNGHSNVIYIRKIPSASKHAVHKSMIKVDYVNGANQLIGRRSFVGQSGIHFRLQDHKASIPRGYRFSKVLVGGNVNHFSANTQIIVVALDKVRVHSNVIIHYMHNSHQVGHIAAKGLEGNHFNLTPFKHQTPAHYHFVKVDGSIPTTFKSDNVNINVQVAPDKVKPKAKAHHPAKPAVQSNVKHLRREQQEIKNDQDLGKVLSEIGNSLNSLGKIIQSRNNSNF